MAKTSAGLLAWRVQDGVTQVFLVHPGGPFWARRDAGAWSIPKGEIGAGEAPLAAARREFQEETGFAVEGVFEPLAPVRQAGGKVVQAWAVAADLDAAAVRSTLFSIEWPRGSGRMKEFPEVDRAAWFALVEARVRILAGQVPLLDELARRRGEPPARPPP